jgi:galactose mutarotase-like enzyme
MGRINFQMSGNRFQIERNTIHGGIRNYAKEVYKDSRSSDVS